MFKLGRRCAIVAALAMVLSAGGSRAYADLTLNVSAASGPTIAIDSTTGMATLSGQPAGVYTYLIDGQPVVFTVLVNNAPTTANFVANNKTVSFEADGAAIPGGFLSSSFDGYSIASIQATQSQNASGQRASLADLSQDVTAANAGSTLTTTAGYNAYTAPTGNVRVTSRLAPTVLDSGTVTFYSTVSGTDVPAAATPLSVTAAQFAAGGPAASPSAVGFATNGNPFPISNQIVLSGVAANSEVNLSASTQVDAVTPEPATLAMAFSVLPLLGIAAWRRRRNPA